MLIYHHVDEISMIIIYLVKGSNVLQSWMTRFIVFKCIAKPIDIEVMLTLAHSTIGKLIVIKLNSKQTNKNSSIDSVYFQPTR